MNYHRQGWLTPALLLAVSALPANLAAMPAPPAPHAARVHGAPPPFIPPARLKSPDGSPWQALANAAPISPGAMLQLTDGSVMVQDQGSRNNGTGNWWKLTPDITGSYQNGTWSQLASMPANYAPLYYGSAILPDGRVIVMGGEYNFGRERWTNLGAIYDPLANSWTAVKHPKGSEWVRIGDGPSSVLANGTFMLGASGYSGTTAQALLNAKKLKWTATGTGKADGNGEEGWSLLPNGDLLTVDTTDTDPAQNTEIYTPATGSWASAGTTPAQLIGDGEVGPQVLRPDGTVFAVGATGANAIYNTASALWSSGPSFPIIEGAQYGSADGPSAVVPDGQVLVAASPGVYQTPTHYYLFDGDVLNPVVDPPNAANESSYDIFMMVLPTGQILVNDRVGYLGVYTDSGVAQSAWQPVVTNVPTRLKAGSSYTVTGTQLNGLTQGSAYGDDFQNATNYPLVQLVITATGHVFYARTSGMTSMAVAAGTASSAKFAVPPAIETGAANLIVVANGIASQPVPVTITPAR